MRNQLLKSMDYNETVNMMYIDQNRVVSKRKILVLQVDDVSSRHIVNCANLNVLSRLTKHWYLFPS